MALTITVLDARDGTDQTFALIGQDSTSSTRTDVASTLSEPKKLIVKHSVSGSGANAVDRHLIQASQRKLDSAGLPRDAVVNLTVAVPRSSVITTNMVEDLIANIVSLLCNHAFSATTGFTNDTVIQQILRGES
jgi:hypothetical protein